MSTEVEICSNALVLLGASPIASLNEPTDRAQRAANLYPSVRRSVLRAHPWNCATKRVVLSPDEQPPEFGWTYRFRLPGDWLRTLEVGIHGDETRFRSEGRHLLAECNPLYLRYVWLNTNAADYDSLLIDALTRAMAAALAKPITGSDSAIDTFERQLANVLRTARAVDGQEDPPETLGRPHLRGVRG